MLLVERREYSSDAVELLLLVDRDVASAVLETGGCHISASRASDVSSTYFLDLQSDVVCLPSRQPLPSLPPSAYSTQVRQPLLT